MAVRAQQSESEKGVDPFDKFFRPAGEIPLQAAAMATATAVPVSTAPDESFSIPPRFPTQTRLDINAASEAELENIPGIGPSIAQRIIEARPLKSADDLQQIKGIGAGKRYEKIRAFFN